MRRRNWKAVQPTSLRQALELCKEHARETRNLSVERIAERMGLPDHAVLYKWLANGRMPALLIPGYENVCGINLVSRWLAATGGKLLVDIPTGRNCSGQELHTLQTELTSAMGALLDFYNGKRDPLETLAAVRTAMEGLGWHHGNLAQHDHPQLDLGGTHEH
ncbi:hypothetical protein D9M68_325400 [compost metagenome]